MSFNGNSCKFSEYIAYVDESGDHSLQKIDEKYPVFVLVFCIFKINNYLDFIKKITELKFKYFGHDKVIFHENDIRYNKGDFRYFTQEIQNEFMSNYWNIVINTKFTVIASLIDKIKHKNRYSLPQNPYSLSMKFCLERFNLFLQNLKIDSNKLSHIIVEQRGKNEDKDLSLEFKKICQENNFNFKLIMANKQTNCAGLQIADLIARPIGLDYIKPGQKNRGFEIIKEKFRTNASGYLNCGLKIFP